ncbi:MAG: hypothetical protein HC802_18275, partial [Caldilineaceae bacterium]|nr:hypothetical protein [Caldilineaceae bacterium]
MAIRISTPETDHHHVERGLLLGLTLVALFVRIWWLDRRGLTYDEAFTALIARISAAEILHFHWTAAFEHTPLWALTMRLWSMLAGQREFALRFFPLMAGVLTVPLFWQLLRSMAKPAQPLRVVATILLIFSPVL